MLAAINTEPVMRDHLFPDAALFIEDGIITDHKINISTAILGGIVRA